MRSPLAQTPIFLTPPAGEGPPSPAGFRPPARIGLGIRFGFLPTTRRTVLQAVFWPIYCLAMDGRSVLLGIGVGFIILKLETPYWGGVALFLKGSAVLSIRPKPDLLPTTKLCSLCTGCVVGRGRRQRGGRRGGCARGPAAPEDRESARRCSGVGAGWTAAGGVGGGRRSRPGGRVLAAVPVYVCVRGARAR